MKPDAIVMPFRGEFGLKVRYHVPAVHALTEPHAVIIEEGEEALYPSASEFFVVPRRADADRRNVYETDFLVELREKLGPDRRYLEPMGEGTRFVPKPHVRQNVGRVDVVVCPRFRRYGAAKNWLGWARVARAAPYTFAAGMPDSSFPMTGHVAWHYARPLDATIEAMRAAKVVVATDAGLAHLAVLCGARLLLVTYRGLVAPGPVIDGAGNVAYLEYWPVRFEEYYAKANHTNATIETVNGWESPDKVASIIERIVES